MRSDEVQVGAAGVFSSHDLTRGRVARQAKPDRSGLETGALDPEGAKLDTGEISWPGGEVGARALGELGPGTNLEGANGPADELGDRVGSFHRIEAWTGPEEA